MAKAKKNKAKKKFARTRARMPTAPIGAAAPANDPKPDKFGYVLPPGKVLVLRICKGDLSSTNGFRWPASGEVSAPDWSPSRQCGYGLHGWLWARGAGGSAPEDAWADPEKKWLVVEVDETSIVKLDGDRDGKNEEKVKFPRGVVVFCGAQQEAIERVGCHAPDDARPMIGYTANAGNSGTANAGDRGTANAGDSGTANAGDRGTANAGYRGTANAGDRGTANAGDRGTANAGHRGMANAGDRGTANAGYSGTANAGDRGTANAGDSGTANAGDRGTATCGEFGKVVAGQHGLAIVGPGGAAMIKVDLAVYPKASGTIAIGWWDKTGAQWSTEWQRRVAFAEVSVDGEHKPNVWYIRDERTGKIVAKPEAH